MKQTKGPRTGFNPQTASQLPRRRNFVLANQADTSSVAQRQIRLPDLPQQDPQLRIATPTHPLYRAGNGAEFARSTVDKFKTISVREMQDPNFEDVGYEPGATKPRFKDGRSIISGKPTQGNQRISGDGTQALARASMAKIGLGSGYDEYKRYGG